MDLANWLAAIGIGVGGLLTIIGWYVNRPKNAELASPGGVTQSISGDGSQITQTGVTTLQSSAQGGGDSNISLVNHHYGMSVVDVMGVLDSNIDKLRHQMTQTMDERFLSFRDELAYVLADSERARIEAIQDPDFLYVVSRAQLEYARSGDQDVKATLIDLIARRSKETERTRLSLTLNDAVEKAALMTPNEFAELSACFLIRHESRNDINSLGKLADHLTRFFVPLFNNVSRENSSYSYLDAQSLIRYDTIANPIMSRLGWYYEWLFSDGLEREKIESCFRNGVPQSLSELMVENPDDGKKLQLLVRNQKAWINLTESASVPIDDRVSFERLYLGTLWEDSKRLSMLASLVPGFAEVAEVYDSSMLKQIFVTSTGVVLAIANLNQIGYDVKFEDWIK